MNAVLESRPVPRSKPTNLASLARGILDYAEEQGIERSRLLRSAELDASALDGSRTRIARDAHVAIWQETERLLADPDFGLKAAESILRPSSFGVVGLLAMTSSNVGESIDRAVTYSRVLREDAVSRCYTRDGMFVVELRLDEPTPRALAESAVFAYRLFMEKWTGEKVRVREVFFQHERPESTEMYERLFPCPVHFGHPTNAIVFDREVMDLPLVTSERDVAGYLEDLARTSLSELERSDTVSGPQGIAAAVRAAVEEGDPSIQKVSRSLGMSSRSLQRTLASHGLEFRQMVDEARWAIAAPLVTTTDLPLEVIAERVGYAEGKAFRRAFRRWAGVSPIELRQASRKAR